MALVFEAQPIPLVTDPGGVVRVGRSRVSLDTVIAIYEQGASAEEILLRLPTLQLSDIHAVLAYYLNHQAEVQDYLRLRQQEEEAAAAEDAARFGHYGMRERLLARLRSQKAP
jgi:uncharacterized protein (DUF433 family)